MVIFSEIFYLQDKTFAEIDVISANVSISLIFALHAEVQDKHFTTSMCHVLQGLPGSFLSLLMVYLFCEQKFSFRFVNALLTLEESSLQTTTQNNANAFSVRNIF